MLNNRKGNTSLSFESNESGRSIALELYAAAVTRSLAVLDPWVDDPGKQWKNKQQSNGSSGRIARYIMNRSDKQAGGRDPSAIQTIASIISLFGENRSGRGEGGGLKADGGQHTGGSPLA